MPYDTIDPSLLQMNQQPNFSWQSRLANGAQGFLGNRDLALALLANSGPSTQKRSFGQILGGSMLQADQMKRDRQNEDMMNAYRMMQMQNMGATRSPWGSIPVERVTPESRKKFEATGKYSDLEFLPEQKQMVDTAEMRNFNFRNSLTPEKQLEFDNIVRQNYQIKDLNGAPTQVRTGPTPQINPLSTAASENAAAAARKAAEAQASAIGAGTGGIIAGIQKKGADAKTVMSTLDIADSLIDASTGSLIGAGADKLAAVFGKAPQGAQAIAQLQVLQAGLMLNMPRMEGPQSDRDVELYRQAAASLGDPTVPREVKKAAVTTIRQLHQAYADRARQPFQLSPQPQSGGWSIQQVD